MLSIMAWPSRSSAAGTNIANSSPPTRAAQQSVSGGMAPLVVRRLQAVEIGDDDGDRKWPFALQTSELVHVERTVVQLGENIVLAEVFQIGLGLLARRDV